jgi:hypothetical protein
VLNGRVLPMFATVVKSVPNQVELLIGLPVILSPEYNLLTDLATWRVHVRASIFFAIGFDLSYDCQK